MATRDDIEIFLDENSFPFEEIAENLWRAESPEDRVDNIIIQLIESLVTVSIRLFKVPDGAGISFYEKLLKYNATEITHGAFALDDENFVILIDTLQLENMDSNELKASLQSIAFTTVQCYKEFGELSKK